MPTNARAPAASLQTPLSLPRRQFLKHALAAGAVGTLASHPLEALMQQPFNTPFRHDWVLLGTQTGGGIFRARWNPLTGQLGTPELAVPTAAPTYLALHPTLPVVYCGNEEDVPKAAISAFTLDRQHAALTPLATQPTGGSTPCFVSVDSAARLLFAANYGGGSLSTFPLDSSGTPAAAEHVFRCDHSGVCGTPGPVHDRQDGPHLHCAVISPDGHFVLACDLGDDSILAFPIQASAGQTPALGPPQRLPARLGSGPRHLAFHPNGRWLYCIHELDCTVDRYTWASEGTVANAQLVPDSVVTLAAPSGDAAKPNTGAEIALSSDGQFLYTCTRGVDILTAFRVDQATGHLTKIQELPCGGQIPRFFSLDPTGHWLLCTNQISGNIAVFARNLETGTLAQHGSVALPTPMCVRWI